MPGEKKAVIEVRHLSKTYSGRAILADVTFAVYPGDVVAVVGPSGCGKTTLLRCLDLLEPFDSGEVRLFGVQVSPTWATSAARAAGPIRSIRSKIGFVFQHLYLWPHKTILENVMEGPLVVLGKTLRDATAEATTLLTKVGLSHRATDYPHRLSGGEQQRAALARVLVMEPDVLLLDEITSNLDPEIIADVLSMLRELASLNRTMIIVTHEMRFAQSVANRVLFLDQGVLLDDMPADAFFANPSSARAKSFIARVGAIRGVVPASEPQ